MPPVLVNRFQECGVCFGEADGGAWMADKGANQTRRFARHSTLQPHPLKALYIPSGLRNRLCKFREEKEIEPPPSG